MVCVTYEKRGFSGGMCLFDRFHWIFFFSPISFFRFGRCGGGYFLVLLVRDNIIVAWDCWPCPSGVLLPEGWGRSPI